MIMIREAATPLPIVNFMLPSVQSAIQKGIDGMINYFKTVRERQLENTLKGIDSQGEICFLKSSISFRHPP
jgi:hypothetical protein